MTAPKDKAKKFLTPGADAANHGSMSSRFEAVWRAVQEKVDSGWAPGIVAGVRHRGTTEYFAAGVRTLGGPEPMHAGTPFRMASLGKPMGGALAVAMMADGTLAPDDPADMWLPELAFPHVLTSPDAPLDSTVAAEHEITVRQLLTLTHGMGYMDPDTPLAHAMDAAGLFTGARRHTLHPDEYMSRVGGLPLAHQPGTRWSYHVGSDILSVLLARAGRAPLGQLLQEYIGTPLGLSATAFYGDPAELPTAYEPSAEGLAVFDGPSGQFSQQPEFESFGGGLVSSVADYLTFLAALADDTLLPAELRAEMTRDQLTEAQRGGSEELLGPGMSWGWQVSVQTGEADPWGAPGRFGWMGGSGTTAFVDPSRELIGVLCTQRIIMDAYDDFSWFWGPLAKAAGPAGTRAGQAG